MRELRPAYHALIGSQEQLALCGRERSVADVLSVLRHLWGAADVSDAALVQALNEFNQETVPADVAARMAGIWLPYSYHPRSQRLRWCLPEGVPTEPFHDEYLSRCGQRTPLNLLVSPRTALADLAVCAQGLARAEPAGFIFHLSRCGSTLLSGCLSELDDAVVFSESPVLTEVLIDPALSPHNKAAHVQRLIDLKASLFPGRKVVVKWNAWDIFHQAWLRNAYPAVPMALLVRDPVEILASHHAQAGRHMSGDPSLAPVAPVFVVDPAASMLEHRIGVLEALMGGMLALRPGPAVCRIDYRQINLDEVLAVAAMWGLRCDAPGRSRMARRMQTHAKRPGERFVPDGARKAALFAAEDARAIAQRLAPLYRALVPPPAHAATSPEVADVC